MKTKLLTLALAITLSLTATAAEKIVYAKVKAVGVALPDTMFTGVPYFSGKHVLSVGLNELSLPTLDNCNMGFYGNVATFAFDADITSENEQANRFLAQLLTAKENGHKIALFVQDNDNVTDCHILYINVESQ